MEKLSFVLRHLFRIDGIDRGEVLVIDDGSSDGTAAYLRSLSARTSFLRCHSIENRGRSGARNAGIDESSGKILLFLQDDIVVSPNWLEEHLRAHRKERCAVVGHIEWYPGAEITRYMKWLEHGGHMLDFRGFRDGDDLGYWRFYTGNVSVPRELLSGIRFDESLKQYGWEDIVLGYHLVQRGIPVRYAKKALVYHWDTYLEEKLPDYMLSLGRSARIVHHKYPDIGVVPSFLKRFLFRAFIILFFPFRNMLPFEWRWYLLMKYYFLKGLQQ